MKGDAQAAGPGSKPYVPNIRATFNQVNAPAGLQLALTGEVATLYDQSQSNQSTFSLTELLSVLFIIVLLLVIYRSLLAPFLTLLPAGLVLTLSQPVIAELHSLVGLQISPITAILLTVLLLGAGTDYGLFLVFRVREEMRGGLSSHDAIIDGVARVGETITFSAGTVIAALLCLLFATFGFYHGLGPALAIGIGLMLLAGVTLLPALLAIFGSAAFWPTSVRPGERRRQRPGRRRHPSRRSAPLRIARPWSPVLFADGFRQWRLSLDEQPVVARCCHPQRALSDGTVQPH